MPVTYDAANGGLFNAWYKGNGSRAHIDPWDTLLPAGATNLTYINSSNDVRWNTSIAPAGLDRNINSQMYKFNISLTDVKWFEVMWEGFGEHECLHQVNLSVWNYSASAWELVDWQGGYDTFDRVLGNRRYELPGANISNYTWWNASISGYELTARASASHHGGAGAGHDSGKGQGILTDYVKVVTHTCNRSEPTFTVDGRKGNWYLWKSQYNTTTPITLNRTTFYFEVIDRTNETAFFASGTAENKQLNQVTSCTHAMWLLPWGGNGSQTDSSSSDPARHRVVAAPIVGTANNTMQDAEYWYPPYSSAVVCKANTLPRAFNNSAAIGEAAAIQNYAITNGSDWNGASSIYDAPYAVGDNWLTREFIDADPRTNGDQWLTSRLSYNVTQNISSFNVSGDLPRVNGSGKFGGTNDGTQLFDVNKVWYNWSERPTDNNGNASGEIFFYYNDSVENYVRTFNSLRYIGTEDNAIVAYESQDFQRSNLNVSDRGAGQNLDVSINITNITGVSQKFNVLLAVFNLSATTFWDKYPYLNGYCVYPNVSANNSSWPYYPAVKTTAVLSPGSSETVTWSNVYTLGTGYDYWLWCSGMVYGPWNAR